MRFFNRLFVIGFCEITAKRVEPTSDRHSSYRSSLWMRDEASRRMAPIDRTRAFPLEWLSAAVELCVPGFIDPT